MAEKKMSVLRKISFLLFGLLLIGGVSALSCDYLNKCPSGEWCNAGTCEDQSTSPATYCASDSDCNLGYNCLLGICIKDSFLDDNNPECDYLNKCPSGEWCNAGTCEDQSTSPATYCASDSDCSSLDYFDWDLFTTITFSCESSICIRDQPLSDIKGATCYWDEDSCYSNQACIDGLCVDLLNEGDYCLRSYECKDDLVCEHNVCMNPNECSSLDFVCKFGKVYDSFQTLIVIVLGLMFLVIVFKILI